MLFRLCAWLFFLLALMVFGAEMLGWLRTGSYSTISLAAILLEAGFDFHALGHEGRTIARVLSWPGWVFLMVPAVLFYVLGRNRRRRRRLFHR